MKMPRLEPFAVVLLVAAAMWLIARQNQQHPAAAVAQAVN